MYTVSGVLCGGDDAGEYAHLDSENRRQVGAAYGPAGENQGAGCVIEPVDGGVVTEADAEPVRHDVRDDRHGITERLVDVELSPRLVAVLEDRRECSRLGGLEQPFLPPFLVREQACGATAGPVMVGGVTSGGATGATDGRAAARAGHTPVLGTDALRLFAGLELRAPVPPLISPESQRLR